MRAILCSLALLLSADGLSAATVWDEAINGDLSGVPSAPTALTFTPGSNVVTNASVNSGDDIRDYFTFVIGPSEVLTAITLLSYTGNPGFTSINSGPTSFIPSPATAGNFLGGLHATTALVGQPLLTLLGTASIAGTGFTPPLGPGTYSFLMQQTSGVATPYALEFQVQVVPLPAAAWLFGTGLLGLAGFRQQRRRVPARQAGDPATPGAPGVASG